jgi:hypothetical protein
MIVRTRYAEDWLNSSVYERGAPKRAVNDSVNADLAAKANALGVSLSEAFESEGGIL